VKQAAKEHADDNDGVETSPPAEDARSRERQRALAEAQQVLESGTVLGGGNHSMYLDGFNLLGVVADPRGPGSQLASLSLPNSYHGRYNTESSTPATPPDTTATSSSSYFNYYTQSLESTLSQMTGQMEALNTVLEDWSRYIVEDGGDAAASGGGGSREHDIPESQLAELPPEIRVDDTSALEAYLEGSGSQATAFHQILLAAQQQQDLDGNNRKKSSSSSSNSRSLGDGAVNEDLVDVSDIPDTFFDPNFDLTNPNTFGNLLLLRVDDDPDENNNNKNGAAAAAADVLTTTTNTDGPVHEWFPLLPQDALGGHLDKVELALLQQVRANSGQFFAESQRFALLQEWIQSMLREVVELQSVLRHLQADLLQPMQTVPVADAQRADLRRLEDVLERAEDLFLCKHGLGGVLSAQDDLTAIEQISYARRLLEGRTTPTTSTKDDEGDNADGDDDEPASGSRVELGRLHSFKTVAEQLNQYEQLVVSNLREELVEIFLSWNSSSSSLYGSSGGGPSSQQFQQPEDVRARVREITGALERCRALSQTKEAFATRLQDVSRMTVRTIVGEFAADVAPNGAVQSVAMSTSSMTLPTFLDCLEMLFEQLLGLLTSASSVDEFFVREGLSLQDDNNESIADATPDLQRSESGQSSTAGSAAPEPVAPSTTPLKSAVIAAAELMSKSISELLRIRKDAHALITLDEMKTIWDSCMGFVSELERLSGSGHTSALRSTLLAPAKAFVERKHEGNMSALAAALDSERWVQCEVSVERQEAMTRLCSGRTILSPMQLAALNGGNTGGGDAGVVKKSQEIEAEGTRYKVVWSCLLLVEMILNNIATASHFSSLSSSLVGKISDLLRLFNSRTTQLVLGAGAIHSHAKLKSINAKHLSVVTQCLGMIMAILPHIRAALMAQLPKKQHTLLTGLDQIRKEYGEHNEKVLNKFVSIIGGIIEHGLAKKISGTDFDERAKSAPATHDGVVPCCVFLEGVSTNTRKMHQVLYSLLPPDHLKDTFSRIFAFIDTKVPALFIAAANIQPVFQKQSTNSPKNSPAKGQPSFSFPKTDEGKRRFLLEVETMTKNLNGLDGVHPWDFTVTNVLERRLEYSLDGGPMSVPVSEDEPTIEDPAEDDAAENPEVSPEQPVDDSDNENSQNPDGKAAENGGATSTAPKTSESLPETEQDSEKQDGDAETTQQSPSADALDNGGAPAEHRPTAIKTEKPTVAAEILPAQTAEGIATAVETEKPAVAPENLPAVPASVPNGGNPSTT